MAQALPNPPNSWAKLVSTNFPAGQTVRLASSTPPRLVRSEEQIAVEERRRKDRFARELVEISADERKAMFPNRPGDKWIIVYGPSAGQDGVYYEGYVDSLEAVFDIGTLDGVEYWHGYNPATDALVEFQYRSSKLRTFARTRTPEDYKARLACAMRDEQCGHDIPGQLANY